MRLAVGDWRLAVISDFVNHQPPLNSSDSQSSVSFVSDIEPDQQGRDRLDRARIGEWAAINVTATGNGFDQRAGALFSFFVVAANDDVAFHFVSEIGQGVGPGVLES